MADKRLEQHELNKEKILFAAAMLFLEKGYAHTTTKDIAKHAGMKESTMLYTVKSKENIMAELVAFVLEEQFTTTAKLLDGVTDDKVLFYAAETTLQLHMAESGEQVREIYAAAYSLPATSEIIYNTITGKLEYIFKEHLPNLESADFYELELASGGIMRSFLTVPCDRYFTMERKIKRFLETTFLVYRVPQSKIDEAIEFVSKFDFEKIANQTIEDMIAYLENKQEEK